MTKRTRILLVITAIIILAPILILTVWYYDYKQCLTNQPPSFDLFIADTFFDQDKSSPWNIVPEEQERPIKWQIDPGQFEKLDTVSLTLTNISGEKFYYTTWGAPFTRFRQDLVIYKNGRIKVVPFDGFGCGTGVYLAPLNDKETMTRTIYNPLMFNPYSNHRLGLEADSFPNQFKEIYGDSVLIKFSQATYSNPWNNYKSQMICSDYIVVSTNKVLDNWRQGKYAHFLETTPTMEEHLGLKGLGQ